MAFLGDLIVRIGANANPFSAALKKAQSMTQTFRNTLKDMEKTASTFAKIAASIKAVNVQMDRLINVSRRALDATQNLGKAEHLQAMNRMRELKMLQSMQEKQAQPRRTSMLDIAGGIGIAAGIQGGVSSIAALAKETISLAAYAETAQITFEVLTGDAAKGARLFKDIQKFAARTSFDLVSAADATKALLAAGVADTDVMKTMQLLGDLAMGDAEKLGFLSKAYTDVMNKGKLQGQELRQFAENGVGLVGALAASMGKTNAEILKMSEDGLISFTDMKKALMGLTGEGGRFHNMMARINETFTGQWNSLVENVQTFGRDLGALVLPRLTEIVAEANKLLTAFNSLGDARWKFAGDLMVASFDVAMETIKLNWADMLNSMIDKVTAIDWSKLLNPFASVNINDLRPDAKPGNLQDAQKRLDELMGKLNGGAAPAAANADPMQAARDAAAAAGKNHEAATAKREQSRIAMDSAMGNYRSKSDALLRAFDDPSLTQGRMEALRKESEAAKAAYDVAGAVFDNALTAETNARLAYEQAQASLAEMEQAKAKEDAQSAFNSGISSMFEKLKNSPLMGSLASAGSGVGGMIDRAKIQADALAGTFSNWFNSPDWNKDAVKQQEPQLAGAMAAGSQEAFSNIFAAMLQRGSSDPNVKATEKQTRELKKALKENKPQTWIAMGAIGL